MQPTQSSSIIKEFVKDFSNQTEAIAFASQELKTAWKDDRVKMKATANYQGRSFTVETEVLEINVYDSLQKGIQESYPSWKQTFDNWAPRSLLNRNLKERVSSLTLQGGDLAWKDQVLNAFKTQEISFTSISGPSWSS